MEEFIQQNFASLTQAGVAGYVIGAIYLIGMIIYFGLDSNNTVQTRPRRGGRKEVSPEDSLCKGRRK